jgi:hypothetical protein
MKKGVFLGTVDEIGNERGKGGQLVFKRRVVKITSVSGKSVNELYFDLKITNSSLDGIKEIVMEDTEKVQRPNKIIYDISIGGTKYQLIQILRGLHENQSVGENGDAKVVSLAESGVRKFLDNYTLLKSIKHDLYKFFTNVYAFGRFCDTGNVTNAESMIVSCSTYESVDENRFSDKVYQDMISILKNIHWFYQVGIHLDECCLTNTLKSNDGLKWDITAIRLRIIPQSERFTLALSKIIDISNLLFNNVYFLNSINVQSPMDVDFDFVNKILKAQTGCVGIPNWEILKHIEFMTIDTSSESIIENVLADDAIIDQYINDVNAVNLTEVYKKLTDADFLPSMMRSIISEYNDRANTTGKSRGPKPLMFFGRQLFIRMTGSGASSHVPLLLEAEGGKLKLYTYENGSNRACDSLSSQTILCDRDNNVFISNKNQAIFYFSIHDDQLIATSYRLNFQLHKITVKIAVKDNVIDADSGETSDFSLKNYDVAHMEEISRGEAGFPPMYSPNPAQQFPNPNLYSTEDSEQHPNPQSIHIPAIYAHNLVVPAHPNIMPVAMPQVVYQVTPGMQPTYPGLIPFDSRLPMAPIHQGINPQSIVRAGPQMVQVGQSTARLANTIDSRLTIPLTFIVGMDQYQIISIERFKYCYSNTSGQYKLYLNINGTCYEQPDTNLAMYLLKDSIVQSFKHNYVDAHMRIVRGRYLEIGRLTPGFTLISSTDLSIFPLRLQ